MVDQGEGKKLGLVAAVAAAGGSDEPPAPKAVQLPLLAVEALDDLPDDPAARQQALRQRGRGRPKGSINRSTKDWRAYLLAKYPSPLEVLAETCSRSVHDLADELGCKPAEAYLIQVRAAGELAPYLHGKMPVEVNVSGALPMLMLADPATFGQGGEGAPMLDLSALQVIENQGLSAAASEAVGQYELDSAEETAEVCASCADDHSI